MPYSSSDFNYGSERERNSIVHEQRVARPERIAQAASSPPSPNARGGRDRFGVICVPQYPRQADVAVRRELPPPHVAPARAVPLSLGRGPRGETNFRSEYPSSHEPRFNAQDSNDHLSTISNRDRVQQQHQFPRVLQGHPNVPARTLQGAHDDSGYVLLYTLTSSAFYASCKTNQATRSTLEVVRFREAEAAKYYLEEGGSARETHRPRTLIVPLGAPTPHDSAKRRYGEPRRDVVVID